jgi:hypothetical protein
MLSLLAPVVVCVVPGTAFATEQTDCCSHMSADCDSGQRMSECCSLAVPDLAMTAPTAKLSAIQIDSLDAIVHVSEVVLDRPSFEPAGRFFLADQSPPDHPSPSIEILRV